MAEASTKPKAKIAAKVGATYAGRNHRDVTLLTLTHRGLEASRDSLLNEDAVIVYAHAQDKPSYSISTDDEEEFQNLRIRLPHNPGSWTLAIESCEDVDSRTMADMAAFALNKDGTPHWSDEIVASCGTICLKGRMTLRRAKSPLAAFKAVRGDSEGVNWITDWLCGDGGSDGHEEQWQRLRLLLTAFGVKIPKPRAAKSE
jgi:hypothetical protein